LEFVFIATTAHRKGIITHIPYTWKY
jgi:hypothetical protein